MEDDLGLRCHHYSSPQNVGEEGRTVENILRVHLKVGK